MDSDNLISEKILFTALGWPLTKKIPLSGSIFGTTKNCNPPKTYNVEITPKKIRVTLLSSLKKPLSLLNFFSSRDELVSVIEAQWVRTSQGYYLEYWKKNGILQKGLTNEALWAFQKAKGFHIYKETFDVDD